MIYCITSILGLLILGGTYLIRPESVKGRLLVYIVSLSMFQAAPLLGLGTASFGTEYMSYQALWFQHNPGSELALVAGNNHFAFNEYIKTACEQGVIGFVLFGLLLFYSIFRINAGSRYHCGLVVMIFIFGMFSYPFENLSITSIFYIALASITNSTRVVDRITNMPRGLRYLAGISLLVYSLATAMEYGLRKTVESDMLEVKKKEKSILAPCFALHYQWLDDSPDFVLHYAEELYTGGYYREAIPVLERACQLRCNELVLLTLGECYQRVKKYDKAIESYALASRMTPAYILPHYHLFSIYREMGDEEKARQIATETLSMQVKIVNTTVLRAKHAMRTYLNQTKKGGE